MKKDEIVVIFSSNYSEKHNNAFINHIDNSIGVNHNVACYPNFNQFSLAQVYNKAILEYNKENRILVFLHGDITIKTKDWGKILLKKFNSTNYQIIGVAGTTYLADNGIWWNDRSKMYGIVEHTNGIGTWVSQYSPERKGYIKPVTLVDGVFIAVDCNNIEHTWDEDFKGFHFYDISFCFNNVLDGCNIGVTTDIRILHQSIGKINQEWEDNRRQFINKYKEELPFSIDEFL